MPTLGALAWPPGKKEQKPMDITIPEDLRIMRETIRRFVQSELEPITRQVEQQNEIPAEIVEQMKDLGLFGLTIPEEYGGLGMSTLGEMLVYEELGKANQCFRVRISTSNGIGTMGIVLDGTPEQKEKYLPRIATGEWTSAFALTEPEAGSDASNLKTVAEQDGDHWRLNGRKHFITNGDVAHVLTTMTQTKTADGADAGITAFIVDKDMPGVSVGTLEEKMGMRGIHTCELLFDDCMVPRENVIGGEKMIGQGFKTAMRVLDKGRMSIGAASVGAAQKLLDMSVAYAKERVQFGRPIADFQMIQSMIADMATEIFAARHMLYHTACLRDLGKRTTKEAAMVKLFCSEMANRVADKAVQIFGGMGYMKELPVEMFYRDLRLYRIYEGTSEIQRLVISRDLLKG